MKPNFAVIFDMDGVLVDSLKLNEMAFNHLLEPHGVSMAQIKEKHARFLRGTSLRNLLKLVEEHHGVKFDVDDFSKYDAFNDDDVILDHADLVINSFAELTPEKIAALLS